MSIEDSTCPYCGGAAHEPLRHQADPPHLTALECVFGHMYVYDAERDESHRPYRNVTVYEADDDCKTICVVGCGRGDRVAKLRAEGHDAYGIDIEPRAIANAIDEAYQYVLLADAEDPHDWSLVKRNVGVDRFDLLITERCVSCFDAPEDTCELLREQAETVRHEIAAVAPVFDPTTVPLTPDEWRSRCDPSGIDEWVDAGR